MPRNVVLNELRRGPAIWTVPLFLGGFGMVWTQQPEVSRWSQWSTTTLYALNAALFGAVVLVFTLATWQAGRERRHRVTELFGSTPRPRLQRALAVWLPTLAWPLLVYVPVALVLGVTTTQAATGPPLLGLLATVVPMLAVYAALGFVIGWYVPGRLTAFVAPVVFYFAMFQLAARVPQELLITVPELSIWAYGDEPGIEVWEHPVWWFAPVAAVWFAGLAAALLTLTARRRRWLAAVPLAAAVLAAVPIVNSQEWHAGTPAPGMVCESDLLPACPPGRSR